MTEFTFTQYLIILLVGLLFFREEIMPWVKGKLGIKGKITASAEQMDVLTEYVNHRETEVLDRQTALLEKQNSQLEAQTVILASLKTGVDDVKRKQEEWDKYGIPVRSR